MNASAPTSLTAPVYTGPRVHHVLGGRYLAWCTAAAFGLMLASWDGLAELVGRWAGDSAYGHGFLMPPVIAFFILRNRNQIRATAFRPSWTGVSFLALALALIVIADIARLLTGVAYGYVLGMCALIWTCMGRASRWVLFPVSLLLFAIPLPAFTQATLTADLQLLSTQLGTLVLRLFEVPVLVDGNIIDLGTYRLQVAEACAGLNYLFPLLGIAHLLAYLFDAPPWKRVALVLAAVPVTLIMNAIRIAGVGVLVKSFGPASAEGFVHGFQGWAVFLASTVLLVATMAGLNALGERRSTLRAMFDLQLGASSLPSTRPRVRPVPAQLRVATALPLVALALIAAAERPAIEAPARQDFALFPVFIGSWTGGRTQLDVDTRAVLDADDYVLGTYSRSEADDPPVELFIAYYATQNAGRRPHSPRVCLPGGGWEIERIERRELVVGGGKLPVNRVLMRQGARQLLAYYWFLQRGVPYASEYRMKWDLLVSSVLENRRDGALLRVVTPVEADEEALSLADRRLQAFLEDASPALMRYLPPPE